MKKVFITGAARGIGRACALKFSENGFEVGFCFQHSEKEARALCEQINGKTKAYSYRCDLESMEEVRLMAARVLSEMGEVDVLVNNAGVSSWGLFQDVTEEDFDRVMRTDFKSMFFLTQSLSAPMIARKEGKIINLSSVWGETGASCEVLYSAVKAAVIGFTKALAKELAPSGIQVNAIAPGAVETDMLKPFTFEEKRELADRIPLGRFAAPEEVASLALFLGLDSTYITGQVIGINGGLHC